MSVSLEVIRHSMQTKTNSAQFVFHPHLTKPFVSFFFNIYLCLTKFINLFCLFVWFVYYLIVFEESFAQRWLVGYFLDSYVPLTSSSITLDLLWCHSDINFVDFFCLAVKTAYTITNTCGDGLTTENYKPNYIKQTNKKEKKITRTRKIVKEKITEIWKMLAEYHSPLRGLYWGFSVN